MARAPFLRRYIAVGLVLSVGVALSVTLFLVVRGWELERSRNLFHQDASELASRLERSIISDREVIRSIGGLYAAAETVDRQQFRAFVAGALARNPHIQALEWVPRVPFSQRAKYEDAARSDGYPSFQFTECDSRGQLVRAGSREEYFPVYYVEPLAGNEVALGLDLGSNPVRLEALQRARDTGAPVATARITLVQETGKQFGFLVFLPIYGYGVFRVPPEPYSESLSGFALGVFRIGDLVDKSLGQLNGKHYAIQIHDESAPPGEQLLYESEQQAYEGQASSEFQEAIGFDVGGRKWSLVVHSSSTAVSSNLASPALGALLAGLLITFAFAAYLHIALGRATELAAINVKLEKEVSWRKLVEGALRVERDFAESVIQTVQAIVLVLDTKGRIVRFNRYLEEVSGYPCQEVKGQDWVNTFVPGRDHDRLRASFVRAMRDVQNRGSVSSIVTKDGHEREIEWYDKTLMDASGNTTSLICLGLDITDRRELQERLLRAQRLETAGRIAGQVAHDFNNLLGPMVGYPELIKMRLPQGHPAVPFCDAMMEAAEQMAEINTDMLALSRRGLLERESVNLNQVVRQALEPAEVAPATLEIDLDLAPDLLPVRGSSAQLLRVLSNLVSNARDAMRYTGLLQIKTENVYVDQPFGRYNEVAVGEYAKVTVSDTGCGIPPKIQDRIFDAFFTTKRNAGRRGCGLGLSVVQALVEDHHGYIDLESAAGIGTSFSIYLPAHREALQPSQVERCRGGTETILVVDDDPLQQEVVRMLLEALGYRVETVGSGEEALARLNKGPIDLMVLDMIMPPGMDGAGTYRRAVEVRPGQRAIIVSGLAESERVNQAQALGIGPYLRKPVTLDKLARTVREELERSR